MKIADIVAKEFRKPPPRSRNSSLRKRSQQISPMEFYVQDMHFGPYQALFSKYKCARTSSSTTNRALLLPFNLLPHPAYPKKNFKTSRKRGWNGRDHRVMTLCRMGMVGRWILSRDFVMSGRRISWVNCRWVIGMRWLRRQVSA
jgi:hypothetical protein